MAEQKQFSVQLTKVTETYFPMIQRQLENHSIDMDEYETVRHSCHRVHECGP